VITGKPICSTSDVLANRRNVHHLLWRFRDSGIAYKTADLTTYLLAYCYSFLECNK